MRTAPPAGKWRLAALACALGMSFAAQAQYTAGPQPQTGYPSPSQGQGYGGMTGSATAVAPAPALTAAEVRAIAEDAYVYAYPLVLMELTRRHAANVASAVDGRAPMNQFGHRTALPDARTPGAPWPNTGMLYSSMWYDVSQEPLIVRVPPGGDHYYFLQMTDMWSDVYASRGTRTTGNQASVFAIVGPYWQGTMPAGVDVVRSPTGMGWLLSHIETRGPGDAVNVNRWQAALTARPYSQVQSQVLGQSAAGHGTAQHDGRSHRRGYVQGAGQGAGQGGNIFQLSTPPTVNPAYDTTVSPVDQVAAMDAPTFFGLFTEALRNNPPHANDYPMLDRLRRIGLGNSGPLVFTRLDPAVQQALVQAAPVAGRRIADAVPRLGDRVNGWNMVTQGIGTYGTDYLRRAAVAYAGLGAGLPGDAVYPVSVVDSRGNALRGDENYVLHFDKAQLPPANAFWSLMLYDGKQGFVENAANKYAIHSTDALKYNADGSLDILIRHKAPPAERQANWLPAPAQGPFTLNMRLYWPKASVLEGNWAPPAVVRK